MIIKYCVLNANALSVFECFGSNFSTKRFLKRFPSFFIPVQKVNMAAAPHFEGAIADDYWRRTNSRFLFVCGDKCPRHMSGLIFYSYLVLTLI